MAEVKYVPCVAAILVNSANQVLLLQRDEKPGLAFAGYWTLPGGLVESGETADGAIARELQEEIELELEVRAWKVYERHAKSNVIVVQHVYIGRIELAATDITLNEGQALAYFAANDTHSLKIAYGFDALLQEFFTQLLR